jgi:PST family polysaccharide transporter
MNEPPRKTGLARAAAMGSGAAALSRGLRAVIGLGTISLLSRFLTPTEFGLFALIFFLTNFVQIFADFGLRAALVQRKDVTETELHTAFWTSLALGAVLGGLLFLAAHPIAALFGEPQLAPYVRMIAPIFLPIALQGVPLSLLEREFRFQRIASAELAAGAAGAAVAVGLAWSGASVMALISQQYVIVLVTALTYFFSVRWRPRPVWSLDALRPLLGYSGYITLAGVVGFISGSADRPIVGARISPADLGYLTLAQQILISPVRTITTAIRRVTFPIMSAIQTEPARVASGYLTTLHATFLVMGPICFGILALAEPITAILLGPQWGPVATVLGVLSVYTLIGTVFELNNAIFSARGMARFQFCWSAMTATVNIATLYVAAGFGLMAVVWTKVVVIALFAPWHCWFIARELGVPLRRIPAVVWPPVVAAALMGAGTAALDRWLEGLGVPSLLRLMAGVPTGVLLYAGLILLLDRTRCLELLRRVKRR